MNKQIPPAIAKLRDEMADKALDKLWMTPRSDESGLSLFKDGFDAGYHSREEEVVRLETEYAKTHAQLAQWVSWSHYIEEQLKKDGIDISKYQVQRN